MKTWPDFVKEKLMTLTNTDVEYDKYVEAQQKAISEHKPSHYRDKPVVKSREAWAAELEKDWILNGPENVYPDEHLGDYSTHEVSGYFGRDGGGYDCHGVEGVTLNGELFFFEVSGYHDSWNGGELHWNKAKLIPTPDLTPEYVPAHYKYPGDWNLNALIRMGVSVPPLPDNK
jgi:hypothetical protein